jgi:hypothetical protein
VDAAAMHTQLRERGIHIVRAHNGLMPVMPV